VFINAKSLTSHFPLSLRQFDHRVLALTTLASVLSTYAVAVRSELFKALPASSRRAMHHAVRTIPSLCVLTTIEQFVTKRGTFGCAHV
jgi:hypothetical protein